MAKTASENSQEWIERTVGEGGARVTMTLSPAEAKDWNTLLKKYPGRGGQKTAFIEAVRGALGRKEPTDAELLAMLKRRLDAKTKRDR